MNSDINVALIVDKRNFSKRFLWYESWERNCRSCDYGSIKHHNR